MTPDLPNSGGQSSDSCEGTSPDLPFWCPGCEEYFSDFVDDSTSDLGCCVQCGEEMYAKSEGQVLIMKQARLLSC